MLLAVLVGKIAVADGGVKPKADDTRIAMAAGKKGFMVNNTYNMCLKSFLERVLIQHVFYEQTMPSSRKG